MEVAAFHPCTVARAGLVSVALFVALAPLAQRVYAPGRYPASRSLEPGLSSAPCGTAAAWPTPGAFYGAAGALQRTEVPFVRVKGRLRRCPETSPDSRRPAAAGRSRRRLAGAVREPARGLRVEVARRVGEHHLAGDSGVRARAPAPGPHGQTTTMRKSRARSTNSSRQRASRTSVSISRAANHDRAAFVEDGQHVAQPAAPAAFSRDLGGMHGVDARLGPRERQPGERVEQVVPVVRTGLHPAGLEQVNFVVGIGRGRRNEADGLPAFRVDVRFFRLLVETLERKVASSLSSQSRTESKIGCV